MANKHKFGSKKKIFTNKDRLLCLEHLIENLGVISAACDKIGCSRETFYNWCERYPDFKKAADEIIERQIDFVESKLLQNIRDNNVTAQIFYLKTKGHKRYKEQTQDVNLHIDNIKIDF